MPVLKKWVHRVQAVVVIGAVVLGAGGCERPPAPSEAAVSAQAFNDRAMGMWGELVAGEVSFSYADVVALLDRAVAADSSYRLAYVNKASVLHAVGETAAATEVMEQWLAAHPGDQQARILLGLSYGRDGRAQQAQAVLRRAHQAYTRAIGSYPDSLGLILDRALIQILLDEREAAIRAIDSLLERHPDSEQARGMRAFVLAYDKDAVAEAYWQRR